MYKHRINPALSESITPFDQSNSISKSMNIVKLKSIYSSHADTDDIIIKEPSKYNNDNSKVSRVSSIGENVSINDIDIVYDKQSISIRIKNDKEIATQIQNHEHDKHAVTSGKNISNFKTRT